MPILVVVDFQMIMKKIRRFRWDECSGMDGWWRHKEGPNAGDQGTKEPRDGPDFGFSGAAAMSLRSGSKGVLTGPRSSFRT